jgi:acyl-CoA reductase-like NAD-dependent aldehyde dehydrogenase
MVSPVQVDIVDRLVKDAIAKGATVVAGGERPESINGVKGNYYPPTVLTDITEDMDIYHEEVFGPVMLVFKVKGEDAAVALANGLDLGLQSSVITRNRETGDRIAAKLHAGATCINDFGLCYMNQNLPFGGVKYSGFGRMGGREGLRGYTNQKAVLADRFPLEIPPKLFPVGKYDYDSAKSSVNLLFADGMTTKLKHLLRLLVLGIKQKFSS